MEQIDFTQNSQHFVGQPVRQGKCLETSEVLQLAEPFAFHVRDPKVEILQFVQPAKLLEPRIRYGGA